MELVLIADKEMGITAKLNIDEVLSGLDDLIDRLSQIPDSAATQIEVTGMDDVEAAASEAEVSLEQVGEAAGMVGTDLSSIDTSSLESVSESASTAADDITSVGTSASDIDLSLQGIGEAASFAGSGIGGISEKMQQTKEETKGAADATAGLAEGFGMVEGAVSTLVGLGLAAWIGDITNAAGNFQDSWLQITAMMGKSPDQMKEVQAYWSSAIGQMKSDTGRTAGSIRGFIHEMQIAGLTSTDAVVGGFNAVAGAAGATGMPIENVISSYKRLLMMPTFMSRALIQLGISDKAVLEATGQSVDEIKGKWKEYSIEQKSAILNQILNYKYGLQGIESWKASWDRVKTALSASWDYLTRIFGSLVLPLVVPVLEFLTDLLGGVAGAIDNLNPVFKSISGGIILFGGGLASLAGLWAGFVSLLGGSVPASFSAIATAMTGAGGAASGLLASIGPLGWAILAVVGIVLSAIYVWQNWSNEIIKLKDALTSGDWGTAANMIVGAFTYVGQAIYNAFVYAGQQIWAFITDLPRMIGESATSWIGMGKNFIQWLIQGLMSLSNYLTIILTEMLKPSPEDAAAAGSETGQATGQGLIEGLNQWLLDNAQLIYDTLNLLFNTLMPLIAQLILQLAALIALWMLQAGQKAATDFINGFIEFILQLPGRTWVAFMQTLAMMAQFAIMAGYYAVSAGGSLLWNFISFVGRLPGMAWGYFLQFLGYLASLPGQAANYAGRVGSSIVNSIASYLASLPGRMYQWGMNALNSFVNGIINSIPGLRGALAMVQSLFPASPPKEGPLSEIKASNMYNWMRDIIEAGAMAANEFDLESIMLPNLGGLVTAGSNTVNTSSTKELILHHKVELDLKNAPPGFDVQGAKDVVLAALQSREGKTVLDRVYGEIYGEYKRSTGG